MPLTITTSSQPTSKRGVNALKFLELTIRHLFEQSAIFHSLNCFISVEDKQCEESFYFEGRIHLEFLRGFMDASTFNDFDIPVTQLKDSIMKVIGVDRVSMIMTSGKGATRECTLVFRRDQ